MTPVDLPNPRGSHVRTLYPASWRLEMLVSPNRPAPVVSVFVSPAIPHPGPLRIVGDVPAAARGNQCARITVPSAIVTSNSDVEPATGFTSAGGATARLHAGLANELAVPPAAFAVGDGSLLELDELEHAASANAPAVTIAKALRLLL